MTARTGLAAGQTWSWWRRWWYASSERPTRGLVVSNFEKEEEHKRRERFSSLGPGKQPHRSEVQRTHTLPHLLRWRASKAVSSFGPHSRNGQAMSSSPKDVLTGRRLEKRQPIWITRKVGEEAAAATALARGGEARAVPRTRNQERAEDIPSGERSVYVFSREPFWTTNSDRECVHRHQLVDKWILFFFFKKKRTEN